MGLKANNESVMNELKEEILSDLKGFISSGFGAESMTPKLYQHLLSNCGFIAGKDMLEFCHSHFSDYSFKESISKLERCLSFCNLDYADLNSEIEQLMRA